MNGITTPQQPSDNALPVRELVNRWLDEADEAPCEPGQGYLICATPRSGSYFLCDLIRSTGNLGRPHEFFETAAMRRLGAPDYPTDLATQIATALRRGCTGNGIFGAKVFPTQIDGASMAAIRDGFSCPVSIHLFRRDLVGQAISLTRAAQSGQFFSGQGDIAVPHFDAELIRDYLELIVRWNAGWEVYFALAGIEPLRISYEDLVEDPQTVINRIAAALGYSGLTRIDQAQLTLRIQRDDISAEWRERFLAAQPRALFEPSIRSEAAARRKRRQRRLARLIGLHVRN